MDPILNSPFTAVEPSLAAVESRHAQIASLTKDIEELREIHLHLAELVNQQSSQIDHIEDVVMITKDRVASGTQQLTQAVEYQTRYNRIKLAFMVGAGGVLLVTTPLGAVAGPLAKAAWAYPQISIPLGALFTLKML